MERPEADAATRSLEECAEQPHRLESKGRPTAGSSESTPESASGSPRPISRSRPGVILRIDGPQGDEGHYRMPVKSRECPAESSDDFDDLDDRELLNFRRAFDGQASSPHAIGIDQRSAAAEFEPPNHAAANAPAAVGESAMSRLAWWTATLALLVGGWMIGPALVERFSYAHTRGQMLARYEIAKTALEGDPAMTLSMTGQWVAQKVRPSVVHIRTMGLERLHGPNGERAVLSEGQGSGVVVAADGFILTNEHVVSDASEVWITLSDRREYRATVVGRDSETDLALL
ncbi:MAG: trypsin-like peptidase domain-containing protein, partial [Planctomycetales bacterium]|nr:trypsin-like peptidase domain-containing protein [Planctomycetales bacterium]